MESSNEDTMWGININNTAKSKHVRDVKVTICTINKCFQANLDGLPFKYLPVRMIVKIVVLCITWHNAFPLKSGLSTDFSPRTIVTGMKVVFAKD